jgi:hypothetical protein
MADSPSWLWIGSPGLRGEEVRGSQLCVCVYADVALTLPSDVCVSRRLRLLRGVPRALSSAGADIDSGVSLFLEEADCGAGLSVTHSALARRHSEQGRKGSH